MTIPESEEIERQIDDILHDLIMVASGMIIIPGGMVKQKTKARTALLALFKEYGEAVIGSEDIPEKFETKYIKVPKGVERIAIPNSIEVNRNYLRAEQRTRLNEMVGE